MNQEVLSQAGHSIFSVYSNFLCNIILEIPSMCLLPLPDLNMRLNRPAGVEVLQNLQNQSDLIICTFGLKKTPFGFPCYNKPIQYIHEYTPCTNIKLSYIS